MGDGGSVMSHPEVVTTKAALREWLHESRAPLRLGGGPQSVGLVPTMGYLHEGHLSLARRARAENQWVVLSIFVNPTQFGPGEDLARYPRNLDRDVALAAAEGVDLVFHPASEEMYLPGHTTWVEVAGLGDTLCGMSRPGHFRGVTTVVAKLFALCRADRAYFGQKDAQQALLVRRMAADLDLGVEVVVCPTVREPDGLAMSSRNAYLSGEERRRAPILYRALREAEAAALRGERDPSAVEAAARSVLAQEPGVAVEYLHVVSAEDLLPLKAMAGEVLIAAAVRLGSTRLIDNVVVTCA